MREMGARICPLNSFFDNKAKKRTFETPKWFIYNIFMICLILFMLSPFAKDFKMILLLPLQMDCTYNGKKNREHLC